MSQTVITSAFEQLKAQEAANGGIVVLDEFVFANVPDLDITSPIDRSEGLPDAAQIVHRQAVGKTGMVNNNAVVYSVVMGADVGDFDFNWVGLVNQANQVVAMIVHAPTQKKIKTASGKQGNVLTRSFLMEYNGASEQTQIVTPADTWQIDFTARLNGVDERIRRENVDIYGPASFLADGFKVTKSADQYSVSHGVAYVAGLRAALLFDQRLPVDKLPVTVWCDVGWGGTLTSVWDTSVKITLAENLSDYVQGDEQHYVAPVARINADGSINDLRQTVAEKNQGIIADISGKQPLDDTLTAISGKDGKGIVSFLKLDSNEDGEGASQLGITGGGNVQDALGCVYISAHGIFRQAPDDIRAGKGVDQADKLQAAVDRAKSLRVPLVIDIAEQTGPSAGGFIYVTKTIDITGLREIRGALLIAILPETFNSTYFTPESPPRGVVLKNLNGTFDSEGRQYYSTTTGGQVFDTISVASLRDYTDDKLIGQLHMTCYSHFRGSVWGRRFGTGVRFANAYDNTISGQSAAVGCGSINYYGFEVGSFPYADRKDESNSMTFPRLLLHDNKYRDASVIGSKINVTAVHAEGCIVGDISGLVQNGMDKFCPNGIATLVFSLTGGSIGNINYQASGQSVSIGCVLVDMQGTDVGEIYNNPGTDILLSDVFYQGRKGAVGSVYSGGSVYTDGGSRFTIGNVSTDKNLRNAAAYTRIGIAEVGGDVTLNAGTIDNLVCKGALIQNNYGVVNSGTVEGSVTLTASGELNNLTINGNFTTAALNPRLSRVTIKGAFVATGGGRFEKCALPGFEIRTSIATANYVECSVSSEVTVAVANARAVFKDCNTVSFNFSNAASPVIRLLGGSSAGITMPGVSNGAIIIGQGHVCSAGNTLSGWAVPGRTDVSFGTQTINPYNGKGWVLAYSGGETVWKEMQVFN